MVSGQLLHKRERVSINNTMTDQDLYVQLPNSSVFTCDVCNKTFGKQNGLTKHKNTPGVHNGLRRNEMNEIEFTCEI